LIKLLLPVLDAGKDQFRSLADGDCQGNELEYQVTQK